MPVNRGREPRTAPTWNQLQYLRVLWAEFEKQGADLPNVEPHSLSVQEASELIDDMKEQLGWM